MFVKLATGYNKSGMGFAPTVMCLPTSCVNVLHIKLAKPLQLESSSSEQPKHFSFDAAWEMAHFALGLLHS